MIIARGPTLSEVLLGTGGDDGLGSVNAPQERTNMPAASSAPVAMVDQTVGGDNDLECPARGTCRATEVALAELEGRHDGDDLAGLDARKALPPRR